MLENLKLLRSSYGISQKTLAESIGISQQSINKYENHNIEPDIATLTRLADFFHVSIDYIVGRTDSHSILESSDLTVDEQSILCKYRALSDKQKEAIHMLLDSYF